MSDEIFSDPKTEMPSNVGSVVPDHAPATVGDLKSLADSFNNVVQGAVVEIHNMLGEMQKRHDVLGDEMGGRLVAIGKRVTELEKFLPILGETFAGKMGGTSEESAAILAAFENADPQAFKDAVDAAAGVAKSTETPPPAELPDHIKRARQLEGLE